MTGKTEQLEQLLGMVEAGEVIDVSAATRILYPELKQLASGLLRGETPGHSLRTTGLVHEAYLRLLEGSDVEFRSRVKFLALTTKVMRRVLVDHARARLASKRGGDLLRVSLVDLALPDAGRADVDLLALDHALEELKAIHERPANVVELRYFGGLTDAETAEALDVSERTVRNDMTLARGWLAQRLAVGDGGSERGS